MKKFHGIFISISSIKIHTFQAYVDFLPENSWKGRFTQNTHAKADLVDIWVDCIRPLAEFEGEEGECFLNVFSEKNFWIFH